jgi:Ca2+-binding EF-hand superfamily protein
MEKTLALTTRILAKVADIEEKFDKIRKGLKVFVLELDLRRRGFLTAFDLQQFLASKNIFFAIAEVNLFVAAWDWDLDGRLGYEEFLNWAGGEESDEFSTNELSQMLTLEIKTLQDLENEKFRLNHNEDFNILDLFLGIENKSKSIPCNSLKTFARSQGLSLSDHQTLSIIKRISKSTTNEISYFEFADFFLCNKSYFALAEGFPDPELSPLSMSYSVQKSLIDNEKSEFFSLTPIKPGKKLEKDCNNGQELEKLRVFLALKKDFTVKALFKWFAGKKKTINRIRFEKGCKKLGADGKALLFMLLDKDLDGEVAEDDFWDVFAPRSEGYRLLLANRARQNVDVGLETLGIVKRVLGMMITESEVCFGSSSGD